MSRPDAVPVALTVTEARIAAMVGCERQITALQDGRTSHQGIPGEQEWTLHIEGAAAEMALAKALGWYWDGSVGVFHDQADVRHIHVRRRIRHDGDLIIRHTIDVPGVYALVTGKLPRFRVQGWARWPNGAPTREHTLDPDRLPALLIAQEDLFSWGDPPQSDRA